MPDVEAMKYGGVLPYTVVGGKVAVLLGKELKVDGWSGSNLWAPFGGGIDPGESACNAALREGYEETMGMFGTPAELKDKVDDTPWIHKGGLTYLLRIPYDRQLPTYFRNFYRYSRACKAQTCPEGWYEKTKLKWVWLHKLSEQKLRPEFRETLSSLQQRRWCM